MQGNSGIVDRTEAGTDASGVADTTPARPKDASTVPDASAEAALPFHPNDAGGDKTPDGSCLATSQQAELLPGALFIMLDQSVSMNKTLADGNSRWKDVTDGINEFLSSQASPDLLVGLQYFGLDGDGPGLCDMATYDSADVAIQPVAAAAPLVAMSLASHGPTESAATIAAVQGGLQYANAWLAVNPTRDARFVLISDDLPNACLPMDPVLLGVELADRGTNTAHPYLIATGSSSEVASTLYMSNPGHTFVIDESGDTKAQIVKALSNIDAPPVCEVELPKLPNGATPDPGSLGVVNVETGVPTAVMRVSDLSACAASGGYYFDDPATPSRVILCPSTCENRGFDVLQLTYCPPPAHESP